MTAPLRLVVFDKTCEGRVRPGLSTAWRAGTFLYRRLGRIDASFGATTWDEALDWLATHDRARRIGEIQYWGHGNWGRVKIAEDTLDSAAFDDGHALRPKLDAVRERLAPDALVWLRTCEAFGAKAGHDFAMRLADFVGVRVAGHTYVIGAIQSGLRGLMPGCRPYWPDAEGLREGTPAEPKRALSSSPRAPRTITCFDGAVPSDWFG